MGASRSGKFHLIFDWLIVGTFQPDFDKFYYFYQPYQSLYGLISKNIKNFHFIQGGDFEFIQSLHNNGTKCLPIFDASCEKMSSSNDFVKIATAGRHKKLSTIYIKHNLFHQSRLGRDIELQNTHIVSFKSPRDVLQINTLSQQLGLGSQLKDWYTKATSIPYGHLLNDLTPKAVGSLRFCTNSGSIPIFFLLKRNKRLLFLDDENTNSLHLDNVPNVFQNLKKTLPRNCPKDFIQFLNECIVNLLGVQLQGIPKQDSKKYRDETHQLVLKRSGINKTRGILSSRKEIELISILTPSIIIRLS